MLPLTVWFQSPPRNPFPRLALFHRSQSLPKPHHFYHFYRCTCRTLTNLTP